MFDTLKERVDHLEQFLSFENLQATYAARPAIYRQQIPLARFLDDYRRLGENSLRRVQAEVTIEDCLTNHF